MKKHIGIVMAAVIGAVTIAALTACGGAGQDVQSQQGQQGAQGQQEEIAIPPQMAEATAPLLYEEDAAPSDLPDIGMEQVIAIALERVPGATEADIYELEREYDDGRLEYEGSIYYGGYEYEFEIDGSTGNLLQWEIDD